TLHLSAEGAAEGALGLVPAFALPDARPIGVGPHGVEIGQLHRLLPAGAHEDPPALEVEQLDAVGTALQDPAVELLALAPRFLRPLERGDVGVALQDRTALLAVVLPDPFAEHADRLAVLPPVPDLPLPPPFLRHRGHDLG